jgi:hypothetical protein
MPLVPRAAAGTLLTLTGLLCLVSSASNQAFSLPVSDDLVLLAEIHEALSQGPQCCPEIPPVAASFCLAYDGESASFTPGVPFETALSADVALGCDVAFPSGGTGFVDYDASSPGFNALVARITNGVDDELMWTCATGIDASGILAVPAGCFGGLESGRLDGTHRRPDLSGTTVGFIRLLVSKVSVTDFNRLEYDVTWQFWAGAPVSGGGAHRSDVDDFLVYANPLQQRTTVSPGASSFSVTIFYGTQIVPATFRATLNGEPIGGFTPVAGTRETVAVPLRPGGNALLLEVDGTRSDGHTATDRDLLMFVVP